MSNSLRNQIFEQHGPHDARPDARHEAALHRLADQVVNKLADRLHPDAVPGAIVHVDTDDLVRCLLAGDETAAREMVLETHRADASLRPAYFHSLAPALRQMGDMWDNDEVSFLQVSMAAGWILAIMRAMRRELRFRVPSPRAGHVALFANDPGEDHVIGVTMAADLFREQGWQIDMCAWSSTEQLVELAKRGDYPVIALSVGRRIEPAPLAALVTALRATTPGVRVLIAGKLVALEPEIGLQVRADAAETDFDRALACCKGFVGGL